MANIVETVLWVQYGYGRTYFTSGGSVTLDHTYVGAQCGVSLYLGNSGTATIKSAGMEILYPKANIHPFKSDIRIIGGGGVSNKNVSLAIDNTTIISQDIALTDAYESETHDFLNRTDSAIINSTRSSNIVFTLTASDNGLFKAFALGDNSYIKFYFKQWDLLGESIGNGISGVVCPGRLYNGESGTFTAFLRDGATFHGWYSDAAHTQLVSTNQSYTVTATQDLTLYAYATLGSNSFKDFYFKSYIEDGSWTKPRKYYLKTLTGWQEQSGSISTTINYCFKNKAAIFRGLSELPSSSSTVFKYIRENCARPIFIFKNDLGVKIYVKNISTTSSSISLCIQEYINQWIIIQDGSNVSSDFTVTFQYFYFNNGDYIEAESTVTLSQNIVTKEIYFIDKNGNNYTETINRYASYTVTTPSGYTNFTGWREIYNGVATGRILTVGNSYYDVGDNRAIHYEPVFSS